MSLSAHRARAYLFGACTGAFTALSVVAYRQGRRATVIAFGLLALACGSRSVVNEERASE